MTNTIHPEYFGAIDSLGRKLPEISGFRKDRFVGLFYWTWHTAHSRGREPRNVTEIIKEYPLAVNDFNHPAWKNTPSGYPHFWGEPVLGYYDDNDEYVVRRSAELIANAGVDVIFFDCTNGNHLWDNEYKFLVKVYKKAIKDGVSVPKIAFMLNFCPLEATNDMLHRLYDEFYSVKENEELFFYWEGKPLIMAHPECLDSENEKEKEIFDFFTFRHNEPTYFAKDTGYDDEKKFWGWCSVYPQTKYCIKKNGKIEQMCVSVAQNANDEGLNAMNSNGGRGVYGRSYAKGDFSYSYDKYGKTVTVDKNTENLVLYGLNFEQQWDYAIKSDPEFVFVTGWNELIAGRFKSWEGTENAFPDQFDYERSRDIEPSKTVIGDCYYYQLCRNIRRYKGIPGKAPTENVFYAYRNSNMSRDFLGWGNIRYVANKAENSIVSTKVEKGERLTVTAECENTVTNPKMILLITTETACEENSWEGFEYVINRLPKDGGMVSIEKSTGGFNFEEIGEGKITVKDNVAVFELPLSFTDFGFKWISETCLSGDFLESYSKGQAVPNGRFYYNA